MPVRDGIRTFRERITVSGAAVIQTLIAGPGAQKRLVLRSAYLVCDTDSIGTYGILRIGGDAPTVAEGLALKGSQILYDPEGDPLVSNRRNEALFFKVEAVEGGTNGFADIGAWIYGTYEIES